MLLHSFGVPVLLQQNSWHVKYSLALADQVDRARWYDISVAMGLVSILGILLVKLYREVTEVSEMKGDNCRPVGKEDVVTV